MLMIKLTKGKKQYIQKLAQKYSLELLLLFGSQVTGKTHKESDFDFGYISSRKLDLDDEGCLINDLLFLAEKHDERVINLVNIKKAKPLLLYAMTSQSQLLYEKGAAAFATLRAYGFKKYVETKPLYKMKAERLRQLSSSK